MPDIIKLKPGSPAPLDLDDGELALDEAGRKLYAETRYGVLPIPLDRVALEPSDSNSDSAAYLFSDTGVAQIAPLSAGAGGADRDAQLWRVPGLAPFELGTAAAPIAGIFAITQPTILATLRINILTVSGTANLVLTIAPLVAGVAGSGIASANFNGVGVGAHTHDAGFSLDPGYYVATLTSDGAVTVDTVTGFVAGFETTHGCTFKVS